MDFFEAVQLRRSIRKYSDAPVPAEAIQKAMDAALLAPNSSNLQTWEFYWVKSPAKKKRLVEACLSQSAARTASELIVVVANPSLWKKTNPEMIAFVKKVNAPALVLTYYEKLVPFTYRFTWLSWVKRTAFHIIGLFRPMMRGPASFQDLQEISIKSAALASENFMLAMTSQGYSTCPMEGLDEIRVKRLLELDRGSRVVMAIACGKEDSNKGTWGPRVRFNREWFVKEV